MLTPGAGATDPLRVLHEFKGGNDGVDPYAGLILDSDGNLYGTTAEGGADEQGAVFKLAPNSDGSWTESLLYSFTCCEDGSIPSASLVFDAKGNLYGTTFEGGVHGGGTVFKLTPNSDGGWTESVLYSFSNGGRLANPSNLVVDAAGNLYGTTETGGARGDGTVFRLTSNSDGSWTESELHSFSGTDGGLPSAGLILDASGNLYGTTLSGGVHGAGTVFELTPRSDGRWTEIVLHSFSGLRDGGEPMAPLTFDGAGNLYGTTSAGGKSGTCLPLFCGVVFKLSPNSDGSWTEHVLYIFVDDPGAVPLGGVIFDRVGNLYSTTFYGGRADAGVVFKLAPQSGGIWEYSTLHILEGTPARGPYSGLTLDKAGNLYGTTLFCGAGTGCQGVVFEITP
jgi:uncharacterized repeat protein (TIGR03803 family)